VIIQTDENSAQNVMQSDEHQSSNRIMRGAVFRRERKISIQDFCASALRHID